MGPYIASVPTGCHESLATPTVRTVRKMNARFLLLAIGVASIGCATFPHWRMPHYHEVRPGETLAFIAKGYGVEPGWLASANDIRDPSRLPVGTRLLIPGGGLILHTVRPGDTLATIAALYDVDASTIAQTNGVSAPDRIAVGARLVMPRGARLPARQASPTPGTERPSRTPVATAPPPGVATPKRTASRSPTRHPHGEPGAAPCDTEARAEPGAAPRDARPHRPGSGAPARRSGAAARRRLRELPRRELPRRAGPGDPGGRGARRPLRPGGSLLDKVWDAHTVRELPGGQTQLFIGLHLIHEVTSPQAFAMLREMGLPVRFPERTFATVDHIIPTDSQRRPLGDPLAEEMLQHLERNCAEHGIALLRAGSGKQGIVHVIGPELGLTQPGMTIACGDSHTSTHGAFGAWPSASAPARCATCWRRSAWRWRPEGPTHRGDREARARRLRQGRDPAIIRELGVKGGVGFAYEYAGPVIEAMTIEERMTVCNMSIEGGARCGYVNPDETTFAYLRGRELAPGARRSSAPWRGGAAIASDPARALRRPRRARRRALAPTVTWGINPGQAVGVDERLPAPPTHPPTSAPARRARTFMELKPGEPIAGTRIDVAFIGSCTNGRISDLREAARVAKLGTRGAGREDLRGAGLAGGAAQAEAEGLPEVFRAAGFDWREPAARCASR
jgi:3-isopropylmalate/(R)-2-methylmalate dehydratase large subunit